MKPKVIIEIQSRYALGAACSTRSILKTISEYAPALAPTWIDVSSGRKPLEFVGGAQSTDLMGGWQAGRSRGLHVETWVNRGIKHGGDFGLVVSPDGIDEALCSQIAVLGRALADLLSPQFGLVHVLTEDERDEAIAEGRPDIAVANTRTWDASIVTSAPILAQGIPTLYWHTFLGSPYRHVLERVQLNGGQIAAHTSWGGVLEVADRAPGVIPWESFAGRSREVRALIGPSEFWPASPSRASWPTPEPFPGDGEP